MGKRGPPKTPTKVLKARGSWRAALRKNEPVPTAGSPKMPRDLSPRAKILWKELAAQLREMQILTVADGPALASLCRTRAELDAIQRKLSADGGVIESPNGYKMQSPLIVRENQLYERWRRMLLEFGLTPAARGRIEVVAPPAKKGAPKKASLFSDYG